MARTRKHKYETAQVNIIIPKVWKETLETIMREKAFKENKQINFGILFREILQEKFNLKLPDEQIDSKCSSDVTSLSSAEKDIPSVFNRSNNSVNF